jgi:hypothetical protein
MFQKSILASIFLFWASPGWSNLPEEAPGNLAKVMKEFYSRGFFSPFQDLNISTEGGIFFSSEHFTEGIKGTSYNAKEKKLEMLEKRWARHALDTYYSVRDEEMAKKKYNNPTMTAKLSALPRNLHTAQITWEEWNVFLNSQEVLSLPSWCYIVVINTEKNIKSKEEANRFLNQLLPHLLVRNLIHLEVVWNLSDKGICRQPDPSGDCSLALSGKDLTEAYRKVSARPTCVSNLAEKIEELYRPVHIINIEYEKLQGTLSGLEKEVKEKEAKIRSYISSDDYLDIMCHGIKSTSQKQQQDYELFQKNQKELQDLTKHFNEQEEDLFAKKSVLADSEIELGKEFFKKVKEMTFSSHISHQDHATQVCEDDFKPAEIISAANKEAALHCNILRSKESNPSLKCSTINQEIRNKSALIQQLKNLIAQQETILEQQKKDLENLINGSCSCLTNTSESSDEVSNDPHSTTPKLTILNEESI